MRDEFQESSRPGGAVGEGVTAFTALVMSLFLSWGWWVHGCSLDYFSLNYSCTLVCIYIFTTKKFKDGGPADMKKFRENHNGETTR